MNRSAVSSSIVSSFISPRLAISRDDDDAEVVEKEVVPALEDDEGEETLKEEAPEGDSVVCVPLPIVEERGSGC